MSSLPASQPVEALYASLRSPEYEALRSSDDSPINAPGRNGNDIAAPITAPLKPQDLDRFVSPNLSFSAIP